MGGLSIHDDMLALAQKPFLYTCEQYDWANHANSWPFPGISSAMHALAGSFFVKLIRVSDLRDMGMNSLAGANVGPKVFSRLSEETKGRGTAGAGFTKYIKP